MTRLATCVTLAMAVACGTDSGTEMGRDDGSTSTRDASSARDAGREPVDASEGVDGGEAGPVQMDAGNTGGFSEAGRDCSSGEPVTPNRAGIVNGVVGFGAGTIGGAHGCVYHVTTLADSGQGSLREALTRSEPLWIVFDLSGTISIDSTIDVSSNKTVDGRGQQIELTGSAVRIRNSSENVILHNLIFAGGSANEDAITIRNQARRVWIDHCTIGEYGDGAIDVTHQSTDVTLSWNRIEGHGKAILIGHAPSETEDTEIRVTAHHNYFLDTGERHPRLRFGMFHSFNNLFVRWTIDGAASSMFGRLLSEGNIYEAGNRTFALRAIAYGSDPSAGYARSVDDVLLNGAQQTLNEPTMVPDPPYPYTPDTPNDTMRSAIEANAGWLQAALP